MDFFPNGKKPPKGGPSGLFIDPEAAKLKTDGQRQPGLGAKSAVDVEDVQVKPARKPPAASILDLGGDEEAAAPVAPATTSAAKRPSAAPAAERPNRRASVLDLMGDDSPAPSVQEDTRAEAVDVSWPTVEQEAEVAAQVEDNFVPAEPSFSDNSPEVQAPESGQAQAAEDGSGLKMNFKAKATTSDGEAPSTSKTGSFGGFFTKKVQGAGSTEGKESPFARFKGKNAEGEEKTKPFSGFGGFMKSKQATPKAAGTDSEQVEQKVKPSFKDLLGKVKKTAGAGPTPKAEKKKKSILGKEGVQFIAVSLVQGSEMIWRVTETSISQVESLEGRDVGPIASFTREDVRIYVDMPQSNRQAAELALHALEEKPRVINLSKTDNAIFTTPAPRMAGYKVKVGPGLPLLQTLLKPHFEKNKVAPKDIISGFLLLDVASRELLVVLYHFDTQGNVSRPEVTANPADVHMTLRQFANGHKVDPALAEILLFRNEELVGVGAPKHLYPTGGDIAGLPIATALSLGAMVTTVAALGAGGYAGQEFVQKQILAKKTEQLKQESAAVDKRVYDLVSGSVRSFAKQQTLGVDELVKNAQAFWVPRSKVTMTAELSKQTFTVTLPLAAGIQSTGDEPTTLNAVTTPQVLALTNLKVPENCTKQSPSVTGTLDVIQLTINCETAPSAFNRYRID